MRADATPNNSVKNQFLGALTEEFNPISNIESENTDQDYQVKVAEAAEVLESRPNQPTVVVTQQQPIGFKAPISSTLSQSSRHISSMLGKRMPSSDNLANPQQIKNLVGLNNNNAQRIQFSPAL